MRFQLGRVGQNHACGDPRPPSKVLGIVLGVRFSGTGWIDLEGGFLCGPQARICLFRGIRFFQGPALYRVGIGVGESAVPFHLVGRGGGGNPLRVLCNGLNLVLSFLLRLF